MADCCCCCCDAAAAPGIVHVVDSALSAIVQGKQLNLLSKDFDNSDVSATEFVINGSQLHFLAADEGLNVSLFKYANKDPQSWRGQKLLPL